MVNHAIWILVSSAAVGTVLIGLVQFVVVPFIKVEIRRRTSRARIPQPMDIYQQDDTILYIVEVGPTGVELMSVDPITRSVSQWKDSWESWQKRLQLRVVYFTGQRRPLRPE
jgi:hypothetical protein